MQKKKNQEYKPSKWIYILLFSMPLLFATMMFNNLDNDIWYLLSEGRYIVKNGIYYVDVLSMHEGLQVVVQNWLSASIFWIIYSFFGEIGLFTLTLICNFFICLLLYKISMTISENNRILSLLAMFATDMILLPSYIVSRPQIFSFIILLSTIYVLELYIKTDNKKYLIWLPILSIIEINLHASLWVMMFLFILPYLIDSFHIKSLRTQGYNKKPLFIYVGIAALCGLLNPYFYKAITFIFTSYTDPIMHQYINELLPFSITTTLGKQMALLILTIGLTMTFFREGNIRIRYICLFCGTVILGFNTYKAFSHFILVSIFPLAYFFKDLCPKDFSTLPYLFKKIYNTIIIILCIISVGGSCYFYFTRDIENAKLKHDAETALTVLKENFSPIGTTVYSSFNDGGTVEFYGFKPYIDPRAEVFLKKRNKKDDIFAENYYVQMGSYDVHSFLERYNFTHLLVHSSDKLYSNLEEEPYFILYENTSTGYRLYARNDLFTDEDRKRIIEDYQKVVEAAKKEAESKNTNTNTNTNTNKK